MIYHILYTKTAKQDIDNIYNYISNKLFNPMAASTLIRKIIKTIDILETMPFKFCLYKFKSKENNMIRYIPINNYLIFYTVEKFSVYILRILYKRQNIDYKKFE